MGQVIQIHEVRAAEPRDFINEAYAKLAALPNFRVRDGQKHLSREIFQALVAKEPLAGEAPTGTGKTLAYLIGALAAHEALSAVKTIPIVVATATKGLQAQILNGDVPRLVEAGILDEQSVVIAKGRRNYLCVAEGERLVGGGDTSGQFDLLDADKNSEVQSLSEIRTTLEEFHGRAWDGDFDTYTGIPPDDHERIRASADTCVGRKCEHYDACPFFKARARMSYAKVIIANHDLVLADLTMHRADQEPLFPGGQYIAVFDEAHNLPDKALDAGSAHVDLAPYRALLERIPMYSRNLFRVGDIAKLMDKAHLCEADFHPGQLITALDVLATRIRDIEVDPDGRHARFPGGVIPADMEEPLAHALARANLLHKALADSSGELKTTNLADRNPAARSVIAELLYTASAFLNQVKNLAQALEMFCDTSARAVRWVTHDENKAQLHTSPVEGADVLTRLVWGNPRLLPVMVSATLKDFEGFDRFRARTGMPDSTRMVVLPHIFPYRESEMVLVDTHYSPRFETKFEYRAELRALLPDYIDAGEGTLILFPSASLMNETVPQLRQQFPGKVLCQREAGIEVLVREHKKRIDAGQGSILCGLATMAEGLDLPGVYCTHVVICTIPFVAPTSPVEQELADILGTRYFGERALPDALIKLIQMVGRLMRRETDRGRITVFDKRLVYSPWGRRMLQALPRFAMRCERSPYYTKALPAPPLAIVRADKVQA
jgi:ATP-dependent DNA helicase DinG